MTISTAEADLHKKLKKTFEKTVKAVTAPAKAAVEIVEGAVKGDLKGGVKKAGKTIEDDVTTVLKETSNRIYHETIVDSGVEHGILIFFQAVQKPALAALENGEDDMVNILCAAD